MAERAGQKIRSASAGTLTLQKKPKESHEAKGKQNYDTKAGGSKGWNQQSNNLKIIFRRR